MKSIPQKLLLRQVKSFYYVRLVACFNYLLAELNLVIKDHISSKIIKEKIGHYSCSKFESYCAGESLKVKIICSKGQNFLSVTKVT